MNSRAHVAMLARYNVWATNRLYRHVDALPEADYRRDCGLYFKSVHGTLNHLLIGEHLLWYQRFAAGVAPSLALDAEIETDRGRLRERLIQGALSWPTLLARTDAARFDGRLDYVSTEGVARSLPYAALLAHVFNHGTHHRGQVSAAITAMGYACPEIDLLWMLIEET